MTNSHRQRWMTALAAFPLLIAVLVIGDWALLAGLLAASVVGQYEFYSMFGQFQGCLLTIPAVTHNYDVVF